MENIPGFDPSKEAAREHFSEAFLQSNGMDSQLVLTLSDIWTTAMFNLQIANNILPKEAEPKLLTDGVAVSHIVDLYRHSNTLKLPLFQEPFGFQNTGEIQRVFDESFGVGSYDKWKKYFEEGKLALCEKITINAT